MNQPIPTVDWPPLYSVKKNKRAKRVRLRASRKKGLEITVPYRFNLKNIALIMEENKKWIIQQLLKIKLYQTDALPTEITLGALNQTWKISYLASDAPTIKIIERPQGEIVLFGRIADEARLKAVLIHWLKTKAKDFLIPFLTKLSEETCLTFAKATIRDQQTRWGSCSEDKAINLNYKLIFLPEPIMRYVLLHELCHTVHLNHSRSFWGVVSAHDPAWQMHRYELKNSERFIPGWI